MAGRKCLAGVAVFMMVLPVWAAADTLESVEKQIVEKAEKVKSLSSRMKTTVESKSEHFEMKSDSAGTYEFARRGEKILFRMDAKTTGMTKMAGQENKTEQTSTSISDGEYIYTVTEDGDGKKAMKMKLTPDASRISGKEMFEHLRKDFNLKLLASEKIDGHDTWVIEAVPKEPAPETTQDMRYYYRQDSGQIARMTMENKQAGNHTRTTVNVTDIKLNPPIDPERFVFKAPEGVEVMDMTALMEAAQAVSSSEPEPEPTPAAEPAAQPTEQPKDEPKPQQEEEPKKKGLSIPRLPLKR